MPYQAINLEDKLGLVDALWSPRIIAEMNDFQFKLVRVDEEFVCQDHANTVETFIALDGSLRIEFRDGEVTLNAGEMYVVPAGVEHQPCAEREVKMLLIEPRAVVFTGAADGSERSVDLTWH